MPHYNLKIIGENEMLLTPAADRSEAIAIFGKELGLKFTLEENDAAPVRADVRLSLKIKRSNSCPLTSPRNSSMAGS